MSIGLALSGVLYPTVGLALYVAWRYAAKWDAQGFRVRALLVRAVVVLVATFPLFWSLSLIYGDFGAKHALIAAGGAAVSVACMLAALAVRKSSLPAERQVRDKR